MFSAYKKFRMERYICRPETRYIMTGVANSACKRSAALSSEQYPVMMCRAHILVDKYLSVRKFFFAEDSFFFKIHGEELGDFLDTHLRVGDVSESVFCEDEGDSCIAAGVCVALGIADVDHIF